MICAWMGCLARGEGVCLDWIVGNWANYGIWEMGCDFFGVRCWARGEGGVVWTGGLSGLGGWTVVRPLPSVQRMKSATGELWELGGWAGWQRRGWL